MEVNNLEFTFLRQNDEDQFSISTGANKGTENFIKQYLRYFQFLRRIIEIHNFRNEAPEEKWLDFKQTFELVGCYRNYDTVNMKVENPTNHPPQQENPWQTIENESLQDSTLRTTHHNEPTAFKLVKQKMFDEAQQLLNHKTMQAGFAKDNVSEYLSQTKLYKSINDLLKKTIGLQLSHTTLKITQLALEFFFKKNNDPYSIESLSAGQKGIIHLIFSLYGYDMEHGLMIIDEPELHLHPQLQKQYLKILEQESKERDIQFIMATHSPAFVSERTINNVKRFYFDEPEQTSKAITPTITNNDKFLVKILNYTNSAKIFFVNKVILVEGESDEYFFNFYLNWFKENNFDSSINIDDYEILNIGGKGAYDNWKKFLEGWENKELFHRRLG